MTPMRSRRSQRPDRFNQGLEDHNASSNNTLTRAGSNGNVVPDRAIERNEALLPNTADSSRGSPQAGSHQQFVQNHQQQQRQPTFTLEPHHLAPGRRRPSRMPPAIGFCDEYASEARRRAIRQRQQQEERERLIQLELENRFVQAEGARIAQAERENMLPSQTQEQFFDASSQQPLPYLPTDSVGWMLPPSSLHPPHTVSEYPIDSNGWPGPSSSSLHSSYVYNPQPQMAAIRPNWLAGLNTVDHDIMQDTQYSGLAASQLQSSNHPNAHVDMSQQTMEELMEVLTNLDPEDIFRELESNNNTAGI